MQSIRNLLASRANVALWNTRTFSQWGENRTNDALRTYFACQRAQHAARKAVLRRERERKPMPYSLMFQKIQQGQRHEMRVFLAEVSLISGEQWLHKGVNGRGLHDSTWADIAEYFII